MRCPGCGAVIMAHQLKKPGKDWIMNFLMCPYCSTKAGGFSGREYLQLAAYIETIQALENETRTAGLITIRPVSEFEGW